jgi:hypothetical protein
MGYEKHQRPLVAPSFTPVPGGIPVADLAHGTDGQLLVGQTGAATAYKSVTGDVTISAAGFVALGAAKVAAANAKVFTAAQRTGTGAAESIAHGLGAVPAVVMAVPTDGGTVTYGTHTTTNVLVTVTTGKKYDIFAWA